jgi:hypothetical protein
MNIYVFKRQVSNNLSSVTARTAGDNKFYPQDIMEEIEEEELVYI